MKSPEIFCVAPMWAISLIDPVFVDIVVKSLYSRQSGVAKSS
jgi:hypothetical protein